MSIRFTGGQQLTAVSLNAALDEVAAITGVASFNLRTGAVVMISADVIAALGYTPYSTANPQAYQTDVQVAASLSVMATKASPALTGTPTINGTAVAYVGNLGAGLAFEGGKFLATAGATGAGVPSDAAPVVNGTAAPGVSVTYSRGDHVHPTDTTRYAASNPSGFQTAAQVSSSVGTETTRAQAAEALLAPLASPTFTGAPTVPGYLTTATASATYAPLASPTFTGTPTVPGYLSTATASATYAPLASPTFTGTPTVPGYLTSATATATYAPLASPTFTGTPTVPGYLTTATATATYATITNLALKAPLANPTFSSGVFETRVAMAANNLDMQAGTFFTKTLTGISTFTVSNVPAAGTVASVVLELTNGAAFAITWWAGMKWAGGIAPTLTAAGIDVLGFYTLDGGTTWRGLLLAKDIK